MLSEHLRIKMRQMQQQPTAPETAHAVFAAPANEGVELASIDKEKVALMLEQHLPAKIERQRQLEQREQREDGRIDKKRVADMLSKHLRTKVSSASCCLSLSVSWLVLGFVLLVVLFSQTR